MKSTQLPPIRVTPSVREEIESALHQGESLSEFVESSALREARRRRADEEFHARGRAAIARTMESSGGVPLASALDAMEARLADRVSRLDIPKRSIKQ